MKKRLLVILVAVAMIVCSMATMSFAAETKAVYDFSSQEFQQAHPVTTTGEVYTLKLTDDDVITVTITGTKTNGFAGIEYTCDSYSQTLDFTPMDGSIEIEAIDGYKITSVKFNIGPCGSGDDKDFYGLTKYYYKDSTGVVTSEDDNQFVAKANDNVVDLTLNEDENYEEYSSATTDTVTKFTVSADSASYWPYLGSIEVTYEAIETPAVTPSTTGANTGDSNNIALYSIVAILALAGAGFVYKRREN